YSGSTKDNILVASLAKQSGAKVACISHFRKSPLTAYSDVTLLCGADVSPLDGGSMAVKMGQLYLMDLLYQEYYSRNYKICRKNNEKTSSAVLAKLF
ncbi:MAG: MurR/RpiR family transcriptional regulator, partial [Lachnospiraceae bacterium]|nr:MurR/RpiR family transcriptional regulator [Lachnospiraceae bacterium]